MGRFVVRGGRTLRGEISVGGSKNAALPIIFSCIMLRGTSVLKNVPDISDVGIAFEILRSFGAVVERKGSTAVLDTSALEYTEPDARLVARLRASTYIIGAGLVRFGKVPFMRFGGCNFDDRPIDMHITAARLFGARCDGEYMYADSLKGADIFFDKVSVGATVNAVLMASGARGKSRIFGYAREPHVLALIDFLRGAGASITVTDECITVEDGELSASAVEIIPDMIEAGTYLSLSLMTDSALAIQGADRAALSPFTSFLVKYGATREFNGETVVASGKISDFADIVAAPYPAFPTDLQPTTAPLLAVSHGGRITEKVWKNRFGYLTELEKFGVRYELGERCATVKPSKLVSACATAPDLRGGAALLLAALSASGESIICGSEIIKRGYADIVNKLRLVGADITEI